MTIRWFQKTLPESNLPKTNGKLSNVNETIDTHHTCRDNDCGKMSVSEFPVIVENYSNYDKLIRLMFVFLFLRVVMCKLSKNLDASKLSCRKYAELCAP